MDNGCSGVRTGEEGREVSSLTDYAEIFIFLQNLGPYLGLGQVKLSELENFFLNGWQHTDTDRVVNIQWRLLRYAYRSGSKDEWHRMAVKYARKIGLLPEAIPYQDTSLHTRMKILRMSCEEQFDVNPRLREVKRDSPGMLTKPIGVDRSGLRYWLLQDSDFDVRLYSEGCYDDVPPVSPSWSLLAWSLDELADQISLLESRHPPSPHSPSPSRAAAGQPPAKKKKKQTPATEEAGGCLKCGKDIDYKQMLLCDWCDQECHTYCQYPVLWVIPKGKWMCPVCKEAELLNSLKAAYLHLSKSRNLQEQQMARKERSVARLQKSGVLLQNILDTEEEGSRSRRSRKTVNYAELNDVYLPPLGPGDLVGREESQQHRTISTRRRRVDDSYIQEDYLAPRVRNTSRRFRPQPTTLETLKESEESLSKSSSPEIDAPGAGLNHAYPAGGVALGKRPCREEEDSASSVASDREGEGEGEDGGHEGDDEEESEGADSPSRMGSEEASADEEPVMGVPRPPQGQHQEIVGVPRPQHVMGVQQVMKVSHPPKEILGQPQAMMGVPRPQHIMGQHVRTEPTSSLGQSSQGGGLSSTHAHFKTAFQVPACRADTATPSHNNTTLHSSSFAPQQTQPFQQSRYEQGPSYRSPGYMETAPQKSPHQSGFAGGGQSLLRPPYHMYSALQGALSYNTGSFKDDASLRPPSYKDAPG